ncbi:MAG TPA: hypothetical protein VMN38_08320 [Sphingomicrobium sp.]|nr:hypothetical protein [Sphingomicrobium sp.]
MKVGARLGAALDWSKSLPGSALFNSKESLLARSDKKQWTSPELCTFESPEEIEMLITDDLLEEHKQQLRNIVDEMRSAQASGDREGKFASGSSELTSGESHCC